MKTLHSSASARVLLLAPSVFMVAVGLTGCSKPLKLKGAKATATRVESTVTTTSAGTVEAEQQAVLTFGGTGRVRRIQAEVGKTARKGDILAELENSDLVRIREDAEREVSRAQELFTSGLISRVALDDARRVFEIAKMNVERSLIRAPFSGLVTELNLKLGETPVLSPTGANAPIRLIDEKERLIKGSVDELDLSKVKTGASARIKILAARPDPFHAQVVRVVPFVSTIKEQDRTSQVEFRLVEKTDRLLPAGASADIEIIVDAKDSALAIPARTVLGLGDKKYVFVWKDGKLEKRDIKIGIGNYERREILSGVTAGEVVTFPPDDAELRDQAKAEVTLQPWP